MLEFLVVMIWVAPLGIIIHEIGHGLPTVLWTRGNAVLHIGKGPVLITFKAGNLHLRLYSIFFLGGHTESRHEVVLRRWQAALISLGGPLANLAAGILLSQVAQSFSLHMLMAFNLYLAVSNLIPFRWKDKYSDGYRFFQVLSKK